MDPQLIRAVQSVAEPNWTAIVQAVAAATLVVVTILGFLFVWLQVRHAATQLRLSRAIANNQFAMELADRVRQFDDIHVRLKDGDWADRSKGPTTADEWNRIERYMGVLDHLQHLVEDGIHTLDQVDNWYSGRIIFLVVHPLIRQKLLVERAHDWKYFLILAHSLESKECYRGWSEQLKRPAQGVVGTA